jgi:hypothetical protein
MRQKIKLLVFLLLVFSIAGAQQHPAYIEVDLHKKIILT